MSFAALQPHSHPQGSLTLRASGRPRFVGVLFVTDPDLSLGAQLGLHWASQDKFPACPVLHP